MLSFELINTLKFVFEVKNQNVCDQKQNNKIVLNNGWV